MNYEEMTGVKEMTSEQLIHGCVELDRRQKQGRELLNRYKAELQARGLAEMEEHNTRYVKYYGEDGTAAISDAMSLDILNPDKLKDCIGEGVFKMKIRENVKTEYKCDPKLERALKALFMGDYTFEYTLDEFLEKLDPRPSTEQKLLLHKKIKGDYEKDRNLLIATLELPEAASLDEELYYLYRIKNAELIQAFLPEEGIDASIEAVRKCILVESKTAITIDYKEEED